jgi:TldD protein
MNDLAQLALDTAVARGAQYADVRLIRHRNQNLYTEDERVGGVGDSESFGFGVRVLLDGAWGFAASSDVTRAEIERVAAEAVDIARVSASVKGQPVTLVPEPARQERFVSERQIDPFTVDISEKVGLLLTINARLRKRELIKKAYSLMRFSRVERLLATSEGSVLESDVLTSMVAYGCTAVDEHDARGRSYEPPARTLGYEIVDAEDLLANTERVAEEAVGHLKADECPVVVTDLVLDPRNIMLTIHESCGHASELDRALGMEESCAGRSFLTPDKRGSFRYGSDLVNLVADNTLPGGLATQGFDDDGVAGLRWPIIEHGLFAGYSTSREVAGQIGLARSTGCCRADSYSSIPIVRQPNLSLLPGPDPLTPEELIGDTKDGIYLDGHGSFSSDQMRLNFQFGGDAFWEIKHGKLGRMLKNVTYQAITPEFWGSCDAICDERFWLPHAVQNCGKGDPMQVAQMTHGAATARFRQIQVGKATAGGEGR